MIRELLLAIINACGLLFFRFAYLDYVEGKMLFAFLELLIGLGAGIIIPIITIRRIKQQEKKNAGDLS